MTDYRLENSRMHTRVQRLERLVDYLLQYHYKECETYFINDRDLLGSAMCLEELVETYKQEDK